MNHCTLTMTNLLNLTHTTDRGQVGQDRGVENHECSRLWSLVNYIHSRSPRDRRPAKSGERTGSDVSDPVQAAWLEALVWPEQTVRLANLRAAIKIAATVC
jgi:hypothetical protein